MLSGCQEPGKVAGKPEQQDTPQKTSAQIRLFLCGDVMTGRGIDQVLPNPVDPRIYESYVKDARDYVRLAERVNGALPAKLDYSYIWGDALQVWQRLNPDLRIINLETSITTHSQPWPGKQIQYRMHPENVKVLTAAKIDLVSLANNHVLDWQRPGLAQTLQTLTGAGIAHAGAGEDLAAARKPAIFKTKAGRVIVLAYGSESSGIPQTWAATPRQSGVNVLPDLSAQTLNMIKQQVKQVKQPGDVVVFSVHWGDNWGYDVPAARRSFAHKLLDEAGVDLIYGHSSHHPLGMEVYKDKLILYGAGDFITDYEGIQGHEEYRGDLTLMYFPELDPATGKLLALHMVPMQVKNFRLNHMKADDVEWLARVLSRECQKLGTDIKLNEDYTLKLTW